VLSDEAYQAVHDACGGALTALASHAEVLEIDPTAPGGSEAAALLAADHARTLRGAFAWLDPAGRAADLTTAPVRPADLARPWLASLRGPGGAAVTLELEDRCGAAAAASGLEAAALARVLGNHLDNAARFATDDRLRLAVVPAGETHARWVLRNAVSDEQTEWLRRSTGEDLLRLYRGGLSSRGGGLGLAACAGVVAACFGLLSGADAVREGYLGAALVGGDYLAWWHWPAHSELVGCE
jgi:hypothetical protein